jgi:CubicO group peptidase (beta-lactamase class C family)
LKIGKACQNKVRWICLILLLSALLSSFAFSACAQPATTSEEASKGFQIVQPESVGLSSAKLQEIDTVIETDMAAKKIDGAVLLVARNGKIAYFKSYGYRDNEKQSPMEKDSIFRVFSMTKSLVAVGTAMLMEEGKLAYTDPVEKYIPSFKDIQVGVISKDENGEDLVTMVPPKTVMTIKNLATHTSGISSMLFPTPGIRELYIQAGMNNTAGLTLAELCEKLAKLPLVEDPGTMYRYGMSYDVLGRIIEVASGMPLDKFFEERIYKPLGMKDSGFLVTGEDIDRLVYLSPKSFIYNEVTDPNKKLLSGSGGSVSTAADWVRFSQMLLNGGELEGKRLLKPETLAYITSDLLGPLDNREDNSYPPGRGYSVGFDFYVRVNTSTVDFPANMGEFCKDGAGGTMYWVDPKEDLTAVFLTSSPVYMKYYRGVIQKMIYQSIIE